MNGAPLPILLNPAAGSGRAGRQRERLEAELRRQGVDFALTVTDSEAHLREETRKRAGGPGALAGAGGDSTFLIMVDEMLKTGAPAGARPKLGLIGLGSSNDIPREFGTATLEKACAALHSGGRTRRVDAGRVRGEAAGGRPVEAYFLGQANIGLGAVVNQYVADLAARHPRLASRQAAAGFLGIVDAYRKKKVPLGLTIESTPGSPDFGGAREIASGSFLAAVIANTRFWATGRMIAPGARPDDGWLDACLIRACSIGRLARINRLAKSGRHVGRKEVTILRGVEFWISSARPFAIQTDGEIVGDGVSPALFLRVGIGAIPSALDLMIP